MKYIDTDHLKAEIEKHIKEVKDAAERFRPNLGFFDAKLSGIYDVMAIIDSLQEEQLEVDLEKGAVQFCFDKGLNLTPYEAKTIARHFYELVLNARKGERKDK